MIFVVSDRPNNIGTKESEHMYAEVKFLMTANARGQSPQNIYNIFCHIYKNNYTRSDNTVRKAPIIENIIFMRVVRVLRGLL
jgi:hypothetical protein